MKRSQDKYKSDKGAKRSRKQSNATKEKCQISITCDYCQKDITHTTRILCAVCSEFDLCLECFSGGVELKGHKYWHDYRVIEDLRFPFLNEEWTAAEEQLLLEGLELYGVRNWSHMADYISTKDAEQCRDHYEEFYMNSQTWPQVSFDHVPDYRESRENAPSNKRAKCPQRARKERRAALRSHRKKHTIPIEPSNPVQPDMCGYMPKRNEFECEWDDECEVAIMNIEFSDQDTPEEFEEKIRALEMYNQRLTKRHQIRKFVVDKKLHDSGYQADIRKVRTPLEEKLHKDYKKYLQVMPPEEHEDFVRGLARQQELEEKIKALQQYRSAGLTSLKEVPEYKKQLKTKKRKSLRSSKSTTSNSTSSSSSSTSWSASPPPSPSSTLPPAPTFDTTPITTKTTQPLPVPSVSSYSYSPVPSLSRSWGEQQASLARFYTENPLTTSSPLARARSLTRPVYVGDSQLVQVPLDQLQRRPLAQAQYLPQTNMRRSVSGTQQPGTHFSMSTPRSTPGLSSSSGPFFRGADNNNVFAVAVI